MKTACVLGAGGFIGSHLVKKLKREGYWVRGADLKYPEYEDSECDEFYRGDLAELSFVETVLLSPSQGKERQKGKGMMTANGHRAFDELYQLAADMGGAGYIFVKEHDADIMHNSALINLHVAEVSKNLAVKKIFYSSSACMYPEHNQLDPNNPDCSEGSAYPADPDSEYGWEKLFSERIFLAYQRNYDLNVKIARFHNIMGPIGTWDGGREKAPAAMCRKVAEAEDGGAIEVWGDGQQTRSFLYIDECLEGIRKMMDSEESGPFNIGSDEMVTINQLAEIVIGVSGKNLSIVNIDGPLGVRGRCSNNDLVKEKLGWAPNYALQQAIENTYPWVDEQVKAKKNR